ncbi:hypothetical protein C8J57DRAFT_1529462 [Mycena rebaudengoi]|nr:hypothetical protein C8J57DRAFT_1529462 [Mycena rebaudengoi]
MVLKILAALAPCFLSECTVHIAAALAAVAAAQPASAICTLALSECGAHTSPARLRATLQRILDPLPTSPVPPTASASSTGPCSSNIVTVSVSPSVAPLLNADWAPLKTPTLGMVM